MLPSEAQRDAVLDAVSWFIEAAPLIELPTVVGPKDMIRNGAAVAPRVKEAILAWDGTSEPPPSLVSVAREFLVATGMEKLLETPVNDIEEHASRMKHSSEAPAGGEVSMDIAKSSVDWSKGFPVLEKLAEGTDMAADRQSVLDIVIAFEQAYAHFIELYKAGKLEVGTYDYSEENLERVKRIVALLQSGLDDGGAGAAAQEVRALAERFLLGFKPGNPCFPRPAR